MLCHLGSFGLADWAIAAQDPGDAVLGPPGSADKSWLAKLIWSRRLDPPWLSSSAGRSSLLYEDLVEGLR
jgi:hypothetical protein